MPLSHFRQPPKILAHVSNTALPGPDMDNYPGNPAARRPSARCAASAGSW